MTWAILLLAYHSIYGGFIQSSSCVINLYMWWISSSLYSSQTSSLYHAPSKGSKGTMTLVLFFSNTILLIFRLIMASCWSLKILCNNIEGWPPDPDLKATPFPFGMVVSISSTRSSCLLSISQNGLQYDFHPPMEKRHQINPLGDQARKWSLSWPGPQPSHN